ncbi:hypothetical protein FL966_02715 [Caproiciproducens galactitolivorans]|uniref:Uncharacterized protein n=1 Tax=Caproiciproducens galactitolivorans TaxID=642589 RepID=A0A4Z0YCK6_9FIRM|nr:hypothetical protein [Caproiciproducens galactitolivorans]QEY34045.1 hypothetical protein FL966_02715 [Caproiciproducens galactitolivorans]TGJ76543.1 hypothetical protein CAGA_14600 [Caproiciproducens galactitolivorans]
MGEYHQKSSANRQERLTKKERIISTRLLTIIQITVCSIILLTVVFVRLIGGNAYMVVKSWYQQTLNNSIVAEEDIENVKHTVVEFFPPVTSLLPKSGTESASSEQPKGGTASQQASQANSDSPKAG